MPESIYPPPFTSSPLYNQPAPRKSLINNLVFRWLLVLALVLMIASLLIFWFGGASFSESGVALTISGPETASVGEEVAYKIKYENKTKTDLTDLNFVFEYPDKAIVMKDGAVSTDSKERFVVDKLASGQSEEKEFKFFLAGNRGDIKTSKIKLTYRAGSLKSQFQKEASLGTTITSLPVALTLSVPPNATNGQPINYILDYRNESSDDLSDLWFEFDFPDGFSVQTTSPKTNTGTANAWSVSQLKRGQGSRISISGTLSGREGETKTVTVLLKRKIGENLVNYEEASGTTSISSPILGLEILANDSRDYSTFLDDSLSYKIKYSNNSNFNIVGLVLTAKLEGEMLNLASLNSGNGFYDASANTITWNSSEISDFANLSPGKKGEVSFSVRIKNQFGSGGTGTKNTLVRVSSRLATPNVPTGIDVDELFVTNSLTTKISTQPVFNQSLYYNDQAFGSTGPMPPRVGQETVFSIHWQLTNPGNDVANAKISATLPSGVTWKGGTSVTLGQPAIAYNKNSSEISWNLQNLPSGVGSVSPKYEAVFQVSIKPSEAQRGSEMQLLKNIKFSGSDSFTKQAIVVNLRDVTSNNTVDRSGEGIVQ